jgi:hypothetical protein
VFLTQLHLKRKTAWSNTSLIGCRVNCLVDYKEWHEGYVTQYHKSGKHLVEFRIVNEKRWLLMKKVAFYIVERPNNQSLMNGNDGEFKETEQEPQESLAPVEVRPLLLVFLCSCNSFPCLLVHRSLGFTLKIFP